MEFCKLMVQNIVVVAGSAFGAEGYYRLSFCKKPGYKKGMEQFEKAYIKVIE